MNLNYSFFNNPILPPLDHKLPQKYFPFLLPFFENFFSLKKAINILNY